MSNERPSRPEPLPNDNRDNHDDRDDRDDRRYPAHSDRHAATTDPPSARSRRFTDSEGRRLLVRPCDSADRGGLRRMYAEFGRDDQAQGIPPLDPDDRRDWLDALFGGRNYVVETGDGEIVGHAALLPAPGSSTAELAVFVAPGSRGVGVGTKLLRALFADPPAGVDTVRLSVERDNRPAVGLYRKLGFEVAARRRYELVMEREPGKLP